MDDSRHFWPIPDHQLCPVCSTRHFPFCTQLSRFAGDNFRFFPSDLRPSHFHHPLYNLQHPTPFPAPQTSGPALFRPPFHPSPFLHEEVMERESFRKRMRMEDPAIGVFPTFEPFDRTLPVENERMLNLVRSHGREGTAQAQHGHHWNNNSDYRMDRHTYDLDNEQKHFSNRGIDSGFPEPVFHHQNGYSYANAYEGYRNQPIPSLDRVDRFIPQERRDFERLEFESDRRTFDQQMVDSYPYFQSVKFEKNLLPPRFHRSDEDLGGSEDLLSGAQQRSLQKDSFRQVSYSSNNNNPVRVENFQDQQQSHSMQSISHLLPTDNYSPKYYHQDHATQNQTERKFEFYTQQGEERRASFHHWPPIPAENHTPLDPQAYPAVEQLGLHTSKQTGYASAASEFNHVMPTSMPEHGHSSQTYPPTPPGPPQSLFADVDNVRGTSIPDHEHSSQAYQSVPLQPLFPIQTEPSQVTSSASTMISIANPAGVNTLAKRQHSSHGSQPLPQSEFYNEPSVQASNGFAIEGSPFIRQLSSKLDERKPSAVTKQSWKGKPDYVDASHLFKHPYRASRPDHIVIILRGFPGSGKSYLAKALRDIEVENGGSAPRIHAMDDYFMMEVEKKVDDNDSFKSSGSARSKKQIAKKVIEYCYEPEMEEAYRSSMLKAFKKTLDDGIFTLVIVDDRNLRVADFAQFWAIAKRSSYEVYLLEATYKDPVGCAARNIHGFKLDDIQKMAKQWEEAPPLYLHLDIQSLFGGDDLVGQSIQEVDMDADDTTGDGEAHHLEETDGRNSTELKPLDLESDNGSSKLGKRWNTEEVEVIPEKNDLQKSKWSKDLSVNLHDSNIAIENTNALSGLIQAYGKDAKFVHWGDKVETSGFSIGANNKQSASSLIIGPGAGYNLKSNPLPEENLVTDATGKISNDTKKRFSEQLRAETESFRAVFDRRRHRVGGLGDADDE